MKIPISELRITAINLATGTEHPVTCVKCGVIDKNVSGVQYALAGCHQGKYPAVREPHEVKVFIDLPDETIERIKFELMCDHARHVLERNKK